MNLSRIILFTILCVLCIGCKKDVETNNLPKGSISIASAKDSIQMPLSVLKDSLFVLNIKAALAGEVSNQNHWVTLGVDTTKLREYREKFGEGQLFPSTSYVFYKKNVQIKNGTDLSDAAELNIGNQTKLTEYTTYVLPVVIKAVDGNEEGAATPKTLFYVFKTGKPLFINRTGWTITSYSSHNGTFVPTNLIDNNDTGTYWASNITQTMPQWFIINFNKTLTFTEVNYYLPTILAYPKNGGYPTSIKIETSMDGTNWVDNGTFAGDIVNNMQSLSLGGGTTAKFLRFTSLAAVKYANSYDAIFISGISLTP